MSYDGDTRTVLMFSGVRGDGSPPLADTWNWDGCKWSQEHPASSPAGRSFGAMTYDPGHQVVVLFGGGAANSDPGRNDTWLWNGRDWSQQHPATSPPIMADATLEYDRANRLVTLIGQSLRPADATVTWTWNGQTWSQRHPAHPPPARSGPGVAYGAKSGILYFGGKPGEAGALNDSWAWDGTDWTALHPPTSPLGGYARMAHEDSRNDVILLEADGTWSWDGKTWTRRPGASPPFEYFRSIAADQAHAKVVVFGGKSMQTNVGTDEVWIWDGTTWSQA